MTRPLGIQVASHSNALNAVIVAVDRARDTFGSANKKLSFLQPLLGCPTAWMNLRESLLGALGLVSAWSSTRMATVSSSTPILELVPSMIQDPSNVAHGPFGKATSSRPKNGLERRVAVPVATMANCIRSRISRHRWRETNSKVNLSSRFNKSARRIKMLPNWVIVHCFNHNE